uniref:Interferon-induced very large GTPase 1 n=1 Tax=Latimeria chalumnae TaxID=7897 RepID=H3AF29_LATCH
CNKKDQCQKKAKEFCDLCLKPALLDYVHKHLRLEVIENFQNSDNYKQYHTFLLKELLEEGVFENYLQYIKNYEEYAKKVKLADVEKYCLSKIVKKVKPVVKSAKEENVTGKVFEPFDKFFDISKNDIVISKESLGMILFLNQENISQFADNILYYIDEMVKDLVSQFEENGSVEEKLSNLPIKPQNELFKKVFGCGKQCPFCKVLCEARGDGHTEHWAEIHHPKGLSSPCLELKTDVCSTIVNSKAQFSNSDTKGTFYPYKYYRDYYPNWKIAGDSSIQASDYWKYVFAKFNEKFAEVCDALKADIPADWNRSTQEKAMESLKA